VISVIKRLGKIQDKYLPMIGRWNIEKPEVAAQDLHFLIFKLQESLKGIEYLYETTADKEVYNLTCEILEVDP
jgi:hypothetical protein